MKNLTIKPGGSLTGRLTIPGDKSVSHRALILSAIAHGTTKITNFLPGEDNFATLEALRELGVNITQKDTTEIEVIGAGKQGLKAPSHTLDLGNAGTGFRLLAGLLAGQPFSSTLIGDASLSQRPMDRIIQPLEMMGTRISAFNARFAPLHIHGAPTLKGIHYPLPVASAQVKSCLLLAGLYAQGTTCLEEHLPTRDHTERLLKHLDHPCDITPTSTHREIRITGGAELQAKSIHVPGDFSSAAFFIVGALIAPGSDLVIEHVGLNPTRIGLITLLQQMGGNIEIVDETLRGHEPIGTLRIRASDLQGITVPPELVPICMDEFPIFFIAGACAQGETILRNAAELRIKETDRLAAMSAGLTTLGITHDIAEDGIRIQGGTFQGGLIDGQHDHRVAMAFSIAALRANSPIYLKNCDKVSTSFPTFTALANAAGLKVHSVYQ